LRGGNAVLVIRGSPNGPDSKVSFRPVRVDGVYTLAEMRNISGVRMEQWRTPGPTDLIFPKMAARVFQHHP
jgi:hypothetical protein